MLSYVEFYQPSYFLLENVTGMLNCTLNGEQRGARITGGVKLGIVKFIVCALTTLGYTFVTYSLILNTRANVKTRYQVRLSVLHAAHYGTPQARRRVIILGSRSGIPLPEFPLATHVVENSNANYKLSTIGFLKSLESQTDDGARACAPSRVVTVRDAIGDLVSNSRVYVLFLLSEIITSSRNTTGEIE